jgi:hypothetical protein
LIRDDSRLINMPLTEGFALPQSFGFQHNVGIFVQFPDDQLPSIVRERRA